MGNLGWLKVHPNCTCVTAAPNDRAEWFSTGHNEDGHRVGASLPTVLTGRVGTFLQGPSSLPRGCSLHPDGPGPPGGATWFWGAVCPLELPMRSGEAYSHWPHPAPSPAQPSPPAMACPESSPCTNPTPCFQGPALRGLLRALTVHLILVGVRLCIQQVSWGVKWMGDWDGRPEKAFLQAPQTLSSRKKKKRK